MGLAEFKRYCEAHQNHENSGESTYYHNLWVNKIFDNSQIAGIRNVELRYKEVLLVGIDKEHSGEIDLVFVTSRDKEVYICEVKVSDKSNKRATGIKSQLRRNYEFARDNFGIFPIRLFLQKTSYHIERKIIRPGIEDLLMLANKN